MPEIRDRKGFHGHGNGYDSGETDAPDFEVYGTPCYRKYFPAALQYGGYHHRRPVCRGRSSGGGGLNRHHHVSHHRFFPGNYGRLYGFDLPAVRSQGSGRCEAKRSQWNFAGNLCHTSSDCGRCLFHGGSFAADEYAGRYFSGRL